jgi:CHAT domain-containing protein
MKSVLLGILIVMSLMPSALAAIREPSDAPAAFAAALVEGDVRYRHPYYWAAFVVVGTP